jgi:hypothetical protein
MNSWDFLPKGAIFSLAYPVPLLENHAVPHPPLGVGASCVSSLSDYTQDYPESVREVLRLAQGEARSVAGEKLGLVPF